MIKKGRILVIDDDEDVLTTARMILRPYYEKVRVESNPNAILKILEQEEFDIIILDMNYKTGATSGNEGLFWLNELKKKNQELSVIMNTAYGDISLAVECMKAGAVDFLVKPWEKEKLLTTVKNIYELQRQKNQIKKLEEREKVLNYDISKASGDLIGRSNAIKKVFEAIDKVAATDANVLILGENGTGKELVARAIHARSKRRDKPFIKVDLGAMTPTLFESELFGHTKGAFTDAREDRAGRFELADSGSLFLDEIGNIPLSLQSKLLSVLQNRQISKVGSHRIKDIDIRLISATNKAIHGLASKEEFRQDLLYRINTIEIILPPLRERKEDIPLLINHFIKIYSTKYEKENFKIPSDIMEKLVEYAWPGNVRELQHSVERAIIMSDKATLEVGDFIPVINKKILKTSIENEVFNVEDLEKNAILNALDKAKGNLTKASDLLGIGRSTLYRKMEKYGL